MAWGELNRLRLVIFTLISQNNKETAVHKMLKMLKRRKENKRSLKKIKEDSRVFHNVLCTQRHESTDSFILLETEPEEERSDDIIIVNYAKLQSG